MLSPTGRRSTELSQLRKTSVHSCIGAFLHSCISGILDPTHVSAFHWAHVGVLHRSAPWFI
jgi:hypothetical protein